MRVLIVDDDAFVLTALRTYLASSPRIEVASAFTRAADALAFLHRVPVDVLLTDVRMPCMDGLELLTRVRARHPGTAVVMLTSFDDDEAMLAALSQAANGFLLKDSAPEEIVRAVLAAADGGTRGTTRRMVPLVAAEDVSSASSCRSRGSCGGSRSCAPGRAACAWPSRTPARPRSTRSAAPGSPGGRSSR